MGWQEEFLDMTNDKQGMMASSPQKIESWQQEFLDIILPVKDKLFRLARRLLVSTDEAEDAVQEVFLKLWKSKDKMDNYKNPEAFAMTMTKNYCLDRLKSKGLLSSFLKLLDLCNKAKKALGVSYIDFHFGNIGYDSKGKLKLLDW